MSVEYVAEGHYWGIIIHLWLCFGSVKTCIFHFLSYWAVNAMGTMADFVSCNLRLAAAFSFFFPSWKQMSLLSASFSTEKRLGPLMQHLHRSLTFPLPATLSHKHRPAQERRGRHQSDTINSKGMFPSVLHCGVNGKTQGDSQWQTQVDLNYCVRGWMMVWHSGIPLFTGLCVRSSVKKRTFAITFIPTSTRLTVITLSYLTFDLLSPTVCCSQSSECVGPH